MGPKSSTNGTNLARGGGGKGYPKINENLKNKESANVKNQTNDRKYCLKCGEVFSKIGGLDGCAFTEVL